MRKIVFVIVLLALLSLLVGCERSQKVGICIRDKDDPLTLPLCQSMEEALTGAGYEVNLCDAANDQSRQDRQIREMIENKVDLLIVEPVMVDAAAETLEQAKSGDVPVIFINREPEKALLDSWEKVCYVGYDAAQPGALQGQMCLELPDGGDLNGDGLVSYVVIAGPEDHLDSQLRTKGCREALGTVGEALATEYGSWSREDGQRRCAKLLADYGKDIEVVFCNSNELALGAMDAIKDGGRTVGMNIYLMGIGGDRQALLLIRSDDLTGTVSLDIPKQTEEIMAAVKNLLSGRDVEKMYYVNQKKVTAETVEAFIED